MPITISSENFASFFNDWLVRHRQFLQLLENLTDETTSLTHEEEKSLATHFLSHCLQYYNEKSAAMSVAGDDVYDFFSPPWLSSYEKLIFWVGGFKPGMVFKLITNSIHDLTTDQQEQLESIRLENKRKERALMQRFALLQQSVADPPLMVLTKRVGVVGVSDGDMSDMEEAMEVLKSEMKVVMKNADQLRCWTMEKVVEIMNPRQAIKLLRGMGEFYLRLRDVGVQIETRHGHDQC